MTASGVAPAVVSIHSFTPLWRGTSRGPGRSACCGTATIRGCRSRLLRALAGEADLALSDIGDNEPYDGALQGDMIDDVATARGLANALIEIART